MSSYGITPSDLKIQQKKIDKQIDYLSSNNYLTANGEYKSYLDISMSANISSRYYAQLVNKVNTLQQVMSNEDLIPVFITQTLDGWFRGLLKGDYKPLYKRLLKISTDDKLSEKDKKEERKKIFASIPPYLREKIQDRKKFTIKDLYKTLRHQWTSFQKTNAHQEMKKEGHNVGYLYVVEPHKDGVPHAHVLLYIPDSYKDILKKEFENKCPAPRNLNDSDVDYEQRENGETNGFQWTLSNPVGYIMKYCTKSFIDVKNGNDLDELQAWYTKYKIRRISMSHTLIPQWVYQKIYPLESCWNYLTSLKLDSTCEWSKEDDYFCFLDTTKNRVLRYDKGLYQIYQDRKLVDEFGTKREIIEKEEYIPPKLKLKDKVKVDFFNHQMFIKWGDNHEWMPYVRPMVKSDNDTLINYYNSLNPYEETDLQHFAVIHNECVDRELINKPKTSLNIEDIKKDLSYNLVMKYFKG